MTIPASLRTSRLEGCGPVDERAGGIVGSRYVHLAHTLECCADVAISSSATVPDEAARHTACLTLCYMALSVSGTTARADRTLCLSAGIAHQAEQSIVTRSL